MLPLPTKLLGRKPDTIVSILYVFLCIYAIDSVIVRSVYRGLFLTCLVELKIIINYDCIIAHEILDRIGCVSP